MIFMGPLWHGSTALQRLLSLAKYLRPDVVFMLTYERECFVSVNRLALAENYTRGMHFGKVALCFLRKINRDRITQCSVETPAMQRPMLAERSDGHNAHFEEGCEYMAFGDNDELVAQAAGQSRSAPMQAEPNRARAARS